MTWHKTFTVLLVYFNISQRAIAPNHRLRPLRNFYSCFMYNWFNCNGSICICDDRKLLTFETKCQPSLCEMEVELCHISTSGSGCAERGLKAVLVRTVATSVKVSLLMWLSLWGMQLLSPPFSPSSWPPLVSSQTQPRLFLTNKKKLCGNKHRHTGILMMDFLVFF